MFNKTSLQMGILFCLVVVLSITTAIGFSDNIDFSGDIAQTSNVITNASVVKVEPTCKDLTVTKIIEGKEVSTQHRVCTVFAQVNTEE